MNIFNKIYEHFKKQDENTRFAIIATIIVFGVLMGIAFGISFGFMIFG